MHAASTPLYLHDRKLWFALLGVLALLTFAALLGFAAGPGSEIPAIAGLDNEGMPFRWA